MQTASCTMTKQGKSTLQSSDTSVLLELPMSYHSVYSETIGDLYLAFTAIT